MQDPIERRNSGRLRLNSDASTGELVEAGALPIANPLADHKDAAIPDPAKPNAQP